MPGNKGNPEESWAEGKADLDHMVLCSMRSRHANLQLYPQISDSHEAMESFLGLRSFELGLFHL